MEIALSTMEAEYIVLSYAQQALAVEPAARGGTKLQLKLSRKSVMKIRVWEDNNVALSLATKPTKFNTQTRHLPIKYHYLAIS